ncbi:hypothetical protein [Bacillus manliponensis]|uniref:Uncharacterized protein n=1 Tax=Bacillus manliponensis TaxID=574376 RepID=A0A073K731_9BACI|nr:hypothetical protein [Bacillus manliponensis]KEK18053.1 hypothetical protein BAMA_07675 [Bacillus manliponensis]
MDKLFLYVLNYILLTLFILGALLLFPFFPIFTLFFAFTCMLGIAIVISCTEETKQKESSGQRARL